MATNTPPHRIQSVETVRVIAIFSVIVLHTAPYFGPYAVGPFPLSIFVNQLTRFAVPLFFVLSGFFWAAKLSQQNRIGAPTLSFAKRVGVIWLFWNVFYLLANPDEIFAAGLAGFPSMVQSKVAWLTQNLFSILLSGTMVHLWFLSSLICCAVISAFFLWIKAAKSLFVLALVLYIVGLLGKAYAHSHLSIHTHFNFDFRNGPFFGLIFFVSGYGLHRMGPKPSWLIWGTVLTCMGFVLHFFELSYIHRRWGESMVQDFVLGTYFVGLGSAMMALSNTPYLRWPYTNSIAPLVLGIYAIHVWFLFFLNPIGQRFHYSLAWHLAFPCIIFLLSSAVAYSMSRFRLTRAFVS